jgi:hypothetical protein
MKTFNILAGALILSLAAQAAMAEELHLLCHVRETKGHAAREFKRRLDIDLSAKTVAFFDDTGHGWEFKRRGPFISADANRVILDAGDGKESAVDRITGQYSFRNERDHLIIRGGCEKTTAEKPKF